MTPETAQNLASTKLNLPPLPSPAEHRFISLRSQSRKLFVLLRECLEFIGWDIVVAKGIGAGISGSDRMLLGPKATEAASNKVN